MEHKYQISLNKGQSLRLTQLAADNKEIRKKLLRHERMMAKLKKSLTPETYKRLEKLYDSAG